MAAFHGKGGSVTFDGDAVSNVIRWSINATANMVEVTDMSDVAGDFKIYMPGFLNWTATVECNLEDSGPNPDVTIDLADSNGAALILLTGQSGSGKVDYYNGTAIVTGVNPSVDKNDVAKVTYTFQGSGVLAEHEVP